MYRQGMASSSIGEHNKKIFYSTRDSTTGTTRITHSSIIGKGKSWDISVQITKETSEIWISTTSVITTHNNFIQNRWFSANHKPPSLRIWNICEVIKVSNNNSRVSLREFRSYKFRDLLQMILAKRLYSIWLLKIWRE